MKGKMTLQRRLFLPILLLGAVMVLSNVLAVISINNVNDNAGTIVDEYMVSEEKLDEIRQSIMDLHCLALSHIVAADHSTMIRLVQEIKEKEKALDKTLEEYEVFVNQEDASLYDSLLDNYEQFKHALVFLVCASADSKTQEAYAFANGDVARFSDGARENIDTLYQSVNERAAGEREHLEDVYMGAICISVASLVMGIVLMVIAFCIIRRHVIAPIRSAMEMLRGSAGRTSGVVDEVRKRVKTSGSNVKNLSTLTQELSAALEEVSGSAAVISASAGSTQEDARTMAMECTAITAYSVEMRERAENMEQAARDNMEMVHERMKGIMAVLNGAIEQSRSVNQINTLTKDIVSICDSTNLIAINASIEAMRAGEAGKGFAVVAQEIRRLADSCGETANHIQEVSGVVTGAVEYLSTSSKELVDYLSGAILAQFDQLVESGKQYRDDAAYVERSMDSFNSQADRLKNSMSEIVSSISSISGAIDGAVLGVTGAAGNTRALVKDMEGIAARMGTNQEIVEELQRQVDVFANL